MLTFDEFTTYVSDHIIEWLPGDYADAQVAINEVVKNNDQYLHGLTIRPKDMQAVPTVYLEEPYQSYVSGQHTLDAILANLADTLASNTATCPVDINDIAVFEKIRDRLKIKLINSETNKQFLKDKPFMPVSENLAGVYYIDFGGIKDEHPTLVITTSLQHSYGVSTAELHAIALENLRDDASFTDLYEVLREFCPDGIPYEIPPEDRTMMYILSNNERLNGAASILCPDVMDRIARQIGKDFLVIPSSIHELLLVPRMDRLSIEDVRNMICNVNSSQVAAADKLSDDVYCYDYATHSLKIAAA